jgi:hypothetical protein
MMHNPYSFGRILLTIVAIVILLIGATRAGLTAPVSPRAVAMADNAFPLSRGLDALSDNPAALALRQSPGWDLRLVDVSSGLGSNALGLSDYRLYNGATLTAADKAAILAKIPAEGWRLEAHAEASALAVCVGSFGLRFSGFGQARGTIDREMLELLFYGNEADRTYVSEFNAGEGMVGAQLSLSYAAGLARWGRTSIYSGLTVRLLRGLYYVQLENAQGSLVAGYTGVSGSGYATATVAEGGSGLAVDWSMLLSFSPRYAASLVLENAVGFIRWSHDPEMREYSVYFEDITADNFEDSLWVEEQSATPISAFSRTLPARLRLGLGRTGEKLNTSIVASIGLSDRLAVSTTPELGLGAEYFLFPFLPLRAGVSVGGLNSFTAGLGGGLHMGLIQLELAARTAGGLWPTKGRGATLSFAGGLHF